MRAYACDHRFERGLERGGDWSLWLPGGSAVVIRVFAFLFCVLLGSKAVGVLAGVPLTNTKYMYRSRFGEAWAARCRGIISDYVTLRHVPYRPGVECVAGGTVRGLSWVCVVARACVLSWVEILYRTDPRPAARRERGDTADTGVRNEASRLQRSGKTPEGAKAGRPSSIYGIGARQRGAEEESNRGRAGDGGAHGQRQVRMARRGPTRAEN